MKKPAYVTSLLLFFLMTLTSFAGHTAPACVAEKKCVPVSIDNQSGQSLYILIHGSVTNKYYDFVNNKYTTKFGPDAVLRVDNQTKPEIFLPGDGISGGGRMIFSTEMLSGSPDLATYPHIFDKIELGWTANGVAGWNTTSVDFFGIPFQLKQGNTTIGFKDGTTREGLINTLQDAMGKEAELYDARFFFQPSAQVLRVFSPQHFYTNLPNKWEPLISEGLDSLVTDDEAKGTGVYFKFNYGGTTFTHIRKLSSNSISVEANGKTQVITDITTGNAVAGQIHPVGNQFAGLLSAVINRGVLGNPKHWGQSGMPNQGSPEFYYQGEMGNYRYNTYAKVLVDASIGARTYATAYDDYWHMDSSIQVGPSSNSPVTIKVLPFKK